MAVEVVLEITETVWLVDQAVVERVAFHLVAVPVTLHLLHRPKETMAALEAELFFRELVILIEAVEVEAHLK